MIRTTSTHEVEQELRLLSARLVSIEAIAEELRVERIALIHRLLDTGLSTDYIAPIAGVSQPRIVQINNKRRKELAESRRSPAYSTTPIVPEGVHS